MKRMIREVAAAAVLSLVILVPAVITLRAQSAPTGTPDLVAGLKSTPGVLGVELVQSMSGKSAIFAWFENKQAVLKWYYSDTHMAAMAQFGATQRRPQGPLALRRFTGMHGEQRHEGLSVPLRPELVRLRHGMRDACARNGIKLTYLPFFVKAVAESLKEIPIVNSSLDESRPAFTPDGRYIGFIRDEANGHERVYVFDTETQTLIDSNGTDLGLVATRDTGSLGLYEKFLLKVTSFPNFGTVNVSLANTVPIGLLVQHVVGHHRLLGRRVPKLKTVGRIPLGKFRHGRHKIHFRPRVHGHRLKPGRYKFTVRALTRRGKVRDLGKPRILRVR